MPDPSRISIDRRSFEAGLRAILDHVLQAMGRVSERKAFDLATPEALDSLRKTGIPQDGRPLGEVIGQLIDTVYPNIARMNHPRFLAFIPSPASPLAWLGDLLTAGYNPHAGSWIQSSGPSCLETELIRWLCDAVGFPEGAGGLFVSGGSMANLTALTVARDRTLPVAQRSKGIVYVSEQTHSSVAKGLKIIGFLDEQIRKVTVDDAFRMIPSQLSDAIARDRAAGLLPFAVVASVGTTNTGSIDPLHAIADLCEAQGLWMHVDGAYGASVVLSRTRSGLADGLDRADSLSWDAHKWLFQTYGCGCVLVRDRRTLLESFSTRPEYLRDASSNDMEPNFWDFGPELTRPARGLKLWLTLQALGSRRIGEAIDHGFQLAEWAQDELRRLPDWRIVSPAQMAIVNFRFEPDGLDEAGVNRLNSGISHRMFEDGFAGVLTTQLRGQTVLRICAIHPDATEEDMRKTVRYLDRFAREELAALRKAAAPT